MDANGNGPQHLEKLFGQLKIMAKETRRSIHRRRGRKYVGGAAPKIPRFYCDVCGTAFDFSIQTNPEPPRKSRCGDCQNRLVSGWTAFITKSCKYHVWVQHPQFRSKVLIISDEQMDALRKRYAESQNGHGENNPPATG